MFNVLNWIFWIMIYRLSIAMCMSDFNTVNFI